MLTYPQIDPVALHLGALSIHWYGLMYAVGLIIFLLLGKHRIRLHPEAGWTTRDLDDLLFYGAIGIIIGGRLGYVLFYQTGYYFSHPLEILAIWQGGMSFHGGFLGVITAMWLVKKNRSWLQITDFIAPLVPPGLAAGRLGNFINGELWGRPTDLPWGMVFPLGDGVARHPSQLYELGLEGIALFLLLYYYSRKPRPTGAVSAVFLIGYGSFRFLVEFTRQPDHQLGLLALGMSMGQWLSIPMMVGGVILLYCKTRRH